MKVEICEGVDQIQTVMSSFPKPLIKVDNLPVVLITLFSRLLVLLKIKYHIKCYFTMNVFFFSYII